MSSRRLGPALAALVLVMATACTGNPAVDPTTGPSGTPSTAAAPSSPPSAGATAPSPAASASETPERVALDEVARHPSGVTVRLEGLERRRGGLVLAVRVTNGATQEAVLAAEPSWTTLVDDTGAVLTLVPPEDHPKLTVVPGDELVGELVFSGALAPDATAVTARFNWVDGEPWNADRDVAGIVSFAFGDLPLAPDTAGAEETATRRRDASVEVREEHPGGVVLELSRVATEGDAILLSVRVVNTSESESTQLAVQPDLTWVEDDLGSRYRLRPPEDNPQLVVDPGEELVGDLAFVGPLEDGASALTLRTNHRRSGSPMNADRPVPGSVSFVVPGLPIP